MNIRITRNTGFYGMGSPIRVLKNGERWFSLNQNQSKEVTVEEAVSVQATFYFLKSKPYVISAKDAEKELEVTMDPKLMSIYLGLFVVILLIPILRLPIAGIFVVIVAYFIFLLKMMSRAYVIKERTNG